MKRIIIALIITLMGVLIYMNNALGETISGVARVIDGDTIEVADHKIRLLCIDTPESNYRGRAQYCIDDETNCGELAKRALIDMIGDDKVRCVTYRKDMYGRDLGICMGKNKVYDHSYNYKLLHDGFAYYYPCQEYPNWKKVYEEAKKNNYGLFEVGFIEPKAWRKQQNKKKK